MACKIHAVCATTVLQVLCISELTLEHPSAPLIKHITFDTVSTLAGSWNSILTMVDLAQDLAQKLTQQAPDGPLPLQPEEYKGRISMDATTNGF